MKYRHRSYCNIIVGMAMVFLFIACDEEYDTVFEERPDERLQSRLDEYQQLLVNAPHGWLAGLKTGTGRSYFYYFNFNLDGTVVMVSDFDETTAGTPGTGTWTLKALQRATLSFDTYSYIHLPADPDGDINGGIDGEGLISDFEFAFDELAGDSIKLQGIQRSSGLYLLPATEEEASQILGKQILNVIAGTKQLNTNHRGLQVELPDGQLLPVVLDDKLRIFGAQYLTENGARVEMFHSYFTFSAEGIVLKKPLNIAGSTIEQLLWDDENQLFTVEMNGVRAVEGYTEPFILPVDPPLHTRLGEEYPGITIPSGSGMSPIQGQSQEFMEAYNFAANSMLEGEYALTLRDIILLFDTKEEIMEFRVVISQGGSLFLAQYLYDYTLDDQGIFKFTFQQASQNGWAIYGDMYPILFHFETDTFKAEFIGGELNLVGGLFSQQNAGYYFSGFLSNQ
ncbi:DUF4302 domain-containing protein [Fulvivirga ulvae]|uniref:DUF4302 domain-containing protein n=1 Tax=Fulvivirga ulvae TaxID=2904245 RepID=UPI001F233E77|nr:DUF4302 domain-containing protein [Fulvivirga ulvae]UII35027.1 DUF4302 domain-containing protein [Fulvivirga ulvae]